MRLCNTKGTTGIIYETKTVFQIQGPATVSAGSLQTLFYNTVFPTVTASVWAANKGNTPVADDMRL